MHIERIIVHFDFIKMSTAIFLPYLNKEKKNNKSMKTKSETLMINWKGNEKQDCVEDVYFLTLLLSAVIICLNKANLAS